MGEEIPEDIRWIHISGTDLGDTFVFEPRIPRNPFESMSGVIEDIVTPRTSWTPSLKTAMGAIGDEGYGLFRGKTYHVYGVEDLPGFVDPGEEFQLASLDYPHQEMNTERGLISTNTLKNKDMTLLPAIGIKGRSKKNSNIVFLTH